MAENGQSTEDVHDRIRTAILLAGLEGHLAEMAHYAQAKDYRRWRAPVWRCPRSSNRTTGRTA
jgi:hypothetical protein